MKEYLEENWVPLVLCLCVATIAVCSVIFIARQGKDQPIPSEWMAECQCVCKKGE
jgi:hypothetical protein